MDTSLFAIYNYFSIYQKGGLTVNPDFVEMIRSADADDLERILTAALERKRQMFPQWDIIYLALPKYDEAERVATLEFVRKWTDRKSSDH